MGAMNNNNLDPTDPIDSKAFHDQFVELRQSNASVFPEKKYEKPEMNISIKSENTKRQYNEKSMSLRNHHKVNNVSGKKKFARGRKTWTDSEVSSLLHAWKENDKHLRSLKRNSHIYEKIAQDLREQGISANSNEVHFKINNLKQRYRKEESFNTPSSWVYYDHIKEIFENFRNRLLGNEEDSASNDNHETILAEIPVLHFHQNSPTETSDAQNVTPPKKKVVNRGGRASIKPKYPPAKVPRRNLSFKKEMLIELRRANDIAERNHAQTEELLREANEINKEWIKLMKEFLDKSLIILENKLDVKKEPELVIT